MVPGVLGNSSCNCGAFPYTHPNADGRRTALGMMLNCFQPMYVQFRGSAGPEYVLWCHLHAFRFRGASYDHRKAMLLPQKGPHDNRYPLYSALLAGFMP